jgi:hypothetical protein
MGDYYTTVLCWHSFVHFFSVKFACRCRNEQRRVVRRGVAGGKEMKKKLCYFARQQNEAVKMVVVYLLCGKCAAGLRLLAARETLSGHGSHRHVAN